MASKWDRRNQAQSAFIWGEVDQIMVFHVWKSRHRGYTRAQFHCWWHDHVISPVCRVPSPYLYSFFSGPLVFLASPIFRASCFKTRGSLRTCFLRSHRLKDEGGRKLDIFGLGSPQGLQFCCFPGICLHAACPRLVFAQALARSTSLEQHIQKLSLGWKSPK